MGLRAWMGVALAVAGCSVVNAPDDPTAPGTGGGGSSCEAPYTTLDDCGACGVACDPQNADGATCESGSCDYDGCVSGYDDCDGDRTDGCESEVTSDPENCGACGNDCAATIFNAATLSCDGGACDYVDCLPTHADCDGDRGNGCEQPVNSLVECGGCGVACAPQNTTLPECDNGVCGYASCTAPFIDCDGDTANGCETDGSSDDMYCGNCATTCGVNETCVGGSCSGVVASCQQIKINQPSSPSGLYPIDPNGGDPSDAFQVYCDMDTDGGGWTLVLNRNVNSDDLGQPDINLQNGVFDNNRATNWNFDIDLFWADFSDVVFADKQNDNCANCAITGYDSAIKAPKPIAVAWSKTCTTVSSAITVTKLVGPSAGTTGTAYSCAATLGWGSCNAQLCHYGVHHQDTSNDGLWSQNLWNEMHFPSAYSSYRQYGTFNGTEGNAYCRSCGGALAATLNQSSTCCNDSTFNAKSRWTIWVR